MRKKLSSIIFMGIFTVLLFTTVPDRIFDVDLSTLFRYPSTLFGWIVCVLGTFFTWFVVVLLYAWLIHRAFIKDENSSPAICRADMPLLKPLPIPTKNRCFYAKPFVWLIEPRRWKVVKDWCYPFKEGSRTIKLIVPKGFEFDGASIPRLLWFFLSPTGLFLIPGLIHDYAYKYNQLWTLDPNNGEIVPFKCGAGKCFWDKLFFKVGRQVNGFWLLNALAWAAVVCVGIFAWHSHVKNGEREKATKPETMGCCSCEATIEAEEIRKQEKDKEDIEN